MWPQGCTWGGGGRFIDNNTLRLAYGDGFTLTPYSGKTEIFMTPLPKPHPNHPPGQLKVEIELDHYDADRQFRTEPDGYPNADWTGRDHASRRIFTRAGVLYSLDEKGREQILHDFNPDVPRAIVSPEWAKAW
jgi:hypothetical protein